MIAKVEDSVICVTIFLKNVKVRFWVCSFEHTKKWISNIYNVSTTHGSLVVQVLTVDKPAESDASF